MQERAVLRRVGSSWLTIAALAVALTIAPSVSRAVDVIITVTEIDDSGTFESPTAGTFRDAVNQVNAGNDTDDYFIRFALDPLLANPFNVFRIELKLDPVDIVAVPITTFDFENRVTIGNDLDPMGTEFFYDIVRVDASGNAGLAFIARDDLTLINADLRAQALVQNGPVTGDDTIDIVYEIGSFVHDVTGEVKEFYFGNFTDGPGRVVKLGPGELALLPEVADYGGGTLLVDGVLRTDTRSLQGDIQICADTGMGDDFDSNDCDNALLIFEMPSVILDTTETRSVAPPTDGTYAGDITSCGNGNDDCDGLGLGKVIKTGVGALTLTGDNMYGGGTYIMQGELIGDAAAIRGDVHVCSSEMVFKPNYVPAMPVNLTDPNILRCASTAKLTFDIPTDDVFGGALLGTGSVVKNGAAKLTFLKTQATFSGAVQINDGELDVNDDLGTAGDPDTVVTVSLSNSTLSGIGAIAGDVAVNSGGILSRDGTVTGNVTVNSGGLLTSSGTITGNVAVNDGGSLSGADRITETLAINSGGTLDLRGQNVAATVAVSTQDASIADGGQISLRIQKDNTPVHLMVTNMITLGAGTISVVVDADVVEDIDFSDPATYSDTYTIVDVMDNAIGMGNVLTGGGAGDGISFANAIFDLDLDYDGDCTSPGSGAGRLCLVTSFAPVLEDDAITKTQREIARVLDRAFNCANGMDCTIDPALADDFNGLYGNFSVPSSELPAILNELAGDEYSAIADVRAAGAARFNRSISRRFDIEFTNGDPAPSEGDPPAPTVGDVSAPGTTWMAIGAQANNNRSYRDYRKTRKAWRQARDTVKEPMPIERHPGKGGFTGWLDIHGVMGDLGGSKNADDIEYRIFGPLFGLDYGLTEHITAGFTLGYTRNEIDTRGSIAKTTGDTYQGGGYVGAMFDKFHLVGSARYAYSDLESRRQIRFNTLNRTAAGDFDARDASAFLEAAYHLRFRDNVIIQPMLSAAYNHLQQASFTESGAGSLNLRIDRQELDTLQTSVGVRIAMFGRDSEDRYMLPQLRMAYEREWLDNDRTVSATLPTAGPGGGFKVDGLAMPRDRAVIGVSSEVGVSDRINLFIDYDLRAGTDLIEHSLAFGLRAIW